MVAHGAGDNDHDDRAGAIARVENRLQRDNPAAATPDFEHASIAEFVEAHKAATEG